MIFADERSFTIRFSFTFDLTDVTLPSYCIKIVNIRFHSLKWKPLLAINKRTVIQERFQFEPSLFSLRAIHIEVDHPVMVSPSVTDDLECEMG